MDGTTADIRRVGIVGGGISGLATAWYLTQGLPAGCRLEVELLEASARFGGPVATEVHDGFLMERGPDSFLSTPSSVLDLVDALGLSEEVLSPRHCEPALMIWARGRLRALPRGMRLVLPGDLRAFMRSDLLSRRGKLRLLAEPLVPAGPVGRDESMGAFFERRLGREVVETLVGPVLAGIYSGDPYALSLRSTFPRFAQMVERHGSLLRALRHLPRETGDAAAAPFRSLRGGVGRLLERLHEAVAQRAEVSLHCGVPVTALGRTPEGRWRLETADARPLGAYDAVVLAVPAFVAAELMAPHASDAAALLASVPYASTAGVYLGFDEGSWLPRSAGVMFPRGAGFRVRGIQLGANKFPGRAPDGGALVRAFLGGVGARSILEEPDEALIAACLEDLGRALRVAVARPRVARVFRYWQRSPQYTVGHAERMARALARLPQGVHVVGNAYRGVGLPACVAGARDLGAALQSELWRD